MTKNKTNNDNYHMPNDLADYSGQNNKHITNKYDYDLFLEENDIITSVIRVKRTGHNETEKWKIMVDDVVSFVLEGNKISKKERDFLRTLDGVNFLIAQAKSGIKSFNKLREAIKEKIKA